jgi:hypothetical protein
MAARATRSALFVGVRSAARSGRSRTPAAWRGDTDAAPVAVPARAVPVLVTTDEATPHGGSLFRRRRLVQRHDEFVDLGPHHRQHLQRLVAHRGEDVCHSRWDDEEFPGVQSPPLLPDEELELAAEHADF